MLPPSAFPVGFLHLGVQHEFLLHGNVITADQSRKGKETTVVVLVNSKRLQNI